MNRKIPYLAVSALLVGLTASGMANAQTNSEDDALLLTIPGEFIVRDGETKGIAHNKTDQRYRVCVTRANINVPLEVMHDGAMDTVSPGDCADFEAMNLQITPAGHLPEDAILMGHFRHIR